MDDQQIQQQMQEHRYEIDTLKETVSKVLISIDNNTAAQQAMTTQFAVYVSKHDTTEAGLKALHAKSDLQAIHIAEMKPVVDGLRGLVWKIVFASIGGGGVIASLATVLIAK